MLFPNATHVIQPLDVGYFFPLKAAWSKECGRWQLAHPRERFNRPHFIPTLDKAIRSLRNKEILRNAFRRCGLYPFNPQAIDTGKIVAEPRTVTRSVDDSSSKYPEVVCPILKVMKNFIPDEVVQQFQQAEFHIWDGSPKYSALFSAWQKFKYELESVREPINVTEDEINKSEEFILLDNEESPVFVETAEILEPINFPAESVETFSEPAQDLLEPTQVKEFLDPVLSTESDANRVLEKESSTQAQNLFQNILFWPKPMLDTNTTKKKKERLPIAVTSEKWKAYFRDKELEKENAEQEKQQKKEEREKKRIEKELLLKKRKEEKEEKNLKRKFQKGDELKAKKKRKN